MPQALGRRSRLALAATLLVAAAVAATLLLQGSNAGADESRVKAAVIKKKRAAVQRLLRLRDTGPGHFFLVIPEEGRDRRVPKILCGEVDPADQQRKLKAFLDRSPMLIGCFATYVRIFPLEGSPAYHVVGTGAIDTGSSTVAMAGLAVAPQLLSHLFSDEVPEEVPAPETVGDETRLFHIADFPIFGDEHPEASLLGWRSGSVLAAIFVQGGDAATNDREAVELARIQQQRIENPAPYTPAERFDREAGFEDPAIKGPVYWLGRTFNPGGSLPTAKLEGAITPGSLSGGLPGEKLDVYYTHDLTLSTWTAAGWRKFSTTSEARRLMGLPCTKTAQVQLSDGSATIYAAPRRKTKRCASNPPVHYFAVAKIGQTAIAVNLQSCPRCNSAADGSAYNSIAGMKAVVKALQLR
jgi:hypothetical protein